MRRLRRPAEPRPGVPAPAGGMGGGQTYGFYLPFNWRGFYDFGSSLIGDWGIHILGPANWGLGLSPEYLISVECVEKDELPPTTFPNVFTIKFEFAARRNMPPVTVYWHQHPSGDAYTPEGMTAEQARKIANTGPQVGPARAAGAGARAGAAGGGVAVRQALPVRLVQAGRPGRPARQRVGAAPASRAAATTASSWAARATWAPADGAKAWGSCRAAGGRTTPCRLSS